MRLLLAVDVPSTTKKIMELQIDDLRTTYPSFQWGPSVHYHIPLLQLGTVNREEIGELKKRITDHLFDREDFYLYGRAVELHIRDSISIFIAFYREKKIEHLVERLREALTVPMEQKFVPHVTIGKTRIPSKQQYFVMKKKFEHTKIDFSFHVTKILLLEREETQYGLKNKTVASFKLLKKILDT